MKESYGRNWLPDLREINFEPRSNFRTASRNGRKLSYDLPRAEGKEAILTLGRMGILPMDFTQEISGMVGFRNILIHEYLKIDREKVYQNTQRVDDFYHFQKLILKFLAKETL